MKYMIIVADGLADQPVRALNGRTPLEAANRPNLNQLAKQGVLGMVRTIPDGLYPGSEVGLLSVLGYDPRQLSVNRAALEAASLGVSLGATDVAYRCNLVTFRHDEEGGGDPYAFGKLNNRVVLEDYSAGQFPSELARELIHDLNDQLGTEFIQFYPGLNYRHLMIWIDGKSRPTCIPPQDILGERVMEHLPNGEGAEILREIIRGATEFLSLHPINEERCREGARPANGIWLWGQGKSIKLPGFTPRYGLQGAVVAAVDLVRGLGLSVGLEVVEASGATGGLDTDYRAKAEAALEVLNEKDLVLLHVEAPDEASHMGDVQAKVRAIEDLDRDGIGTILERIDRFDGIRLIFLPDHAASVTSRRHTDEPVPFVIFDSNRKGSARGSGPEYHERAARTTGQEFGSGVELFKFFLKG